MATKGRSIIQLIRDDTKKVDEQLEQLKEYKDENLITNAISNAANRPFEYRLRDVTDNYISQFYQSLPYLPTNGLGGILLWDSHLEANVNNVIPPIGITNVGYAGNSYAGSDINRGSYNINESMGITNGYRNVWDFGTDKCNDVDINSISLTSRLCGDLGFNVNNTDIAANRTIIGNDDGYRQQRCITLNNDMYPIYFENKFTVVSIKYIATRTLELWRSVIQDCSNIEITTPSMRHTEHTKLADISLSADTSGVTNGFPSIIKNNNILHIVGVVNAINKTIYHTQINLTDYNVTNTLLTLSSSPQNLRTYTMTYCFYNNNYYITMSDGKVGLFSPSGIFIKYIFRTHPSTSGQYFSTYKNMLCLTSINNGSTSSTYNDVCINMTVDGSTFTTHYSNMPRSSSGMYPIDNDYISYPLIMMGYGGSGAGGCNIIGTHNYLGSINNLSNTIRKTSDYNMKIIYEVTNE